jgi:DNA-binding NarL/FixJ family response regulator
MNIKIAIADDHPLVINGIKNILPLYPHLELSGTYTNGTTLLQGLELQVPDVLLLDIQLPGQTGDELTPVILQKYPDLKILALTNFDSPLYANTMFTRGAHGYLLKTADNETLIEAIETVYEGQLFIEPTMKDKMEQASYKIKKALSTKFSLTTREKEILQLIVDGCTTAHIGSLLFLSAKTVENYRSNIMIKLDVNNTASLVKSALKSGLAK